MATNVLIIVAVVTLMLAVAGVVGGQYRIARTNQAVKVATDIATGWEARSRQQDVLIADLERATNHQKEVMTAALADKETEIAELRARVGVLQDLVTGKSEIQKLGEDHNRLEGKIAEALNLVGAVRSDVRSIATAISERLPA